MNIKIIKKNDTLLNSKKDRLNNFEYTEMTLKLNEWLQDTTKCSKIHKQLKSISFTPTNDINMIVSYLNHFQLDFINK